MNRSPMCAAIAVLTLAGASAIAEDVPAQPADAAKPSEMWNVLLGVTQDFQDVADSKDNPILLLDRMATFRHSPETAALMIKVFGTDRPYSVARVAAPKGKVAYAARVQPVAYLDPSGARIEWTALDALLTVDASGRSMVAKGSWPSLQIEDKDVRMSARGMTFDLSQKRGFANLWFGNFQASVPEVRIEGKSAAFDMTLADTRLASSVVQRGKLADVHYKLGTGSISVAGEQVGGFSLAARLVSLDAKSLAEASEKLKKDGAGQTIEQRQAHALPVMKEFLRQSAMRGSVLIIDDLRATYRGNTATVKGRVGVEGRGEIALDASLLKRIVARFTVRVPLAMIQDGAGAMARKQMAASAPGQPVSEQGAAQMAQTITDTVVGQALAKGFARVENGYLVSNLEFRNGVLRVNGKEVALPKPAPAAQM